MGDKAVDEMKLVVSSLDGHSARVGEEEVDTVFDEVFNEWNLFVDTLRFNSHFGILRRNPSMLSCSLHRRFCGAIEA